MSIPFKENVPNVFVGEFHHPKTSRFHCLVVMQSLEQWSAYIDGDQVGTGFSNSTEAQEFAVQAARGMAIESHSVPKTLMALAVLAVGALTYFLAQAGHLNAVSHAFAAAMAPSEATAVSLAHADVATDTASLIPAVQLSSDHDRDHQRSAEASVEPISDATAVIPTQPLIHPPRDNVAFPPLQAQSSEIVVARRVVSSHRQELHQSSTARREKLQRRNLSKARDRKFAAIARKKQRAAKIARLKEARARARTKRLAKKRAENAKRLARERSAAKLASKRSAQKRKARKLKTLKRKSQQRRSKKSKASKLSKIKAVRRAKAKRQRVAKRRRLARIRRAQRSRHRPSARRRMTYREYQMLRNRVIAKRIRQRRRYAR